MTKGKRRELQTQLAKFICKEIMDDDWQLGRKICMSWADEIIEMIRLNDAHAAMNNHPERIA